jgi:hypothetical protein
MTERKLRSGVTWQGALKQKGMKQMAIKQGLGVLYSKDVLYTKCTVWVNEKKH